jgi:hypothetical protein
MHIGTEGRKEAERSRTSPNIRYFLNLSSGERGGARLTGGGSNTLIHHNYSDLDSKKRKNAIMKMLGAGYF